MGQAIEKMKDQVDFDNVQRVGLQKDEGSFAYAFFLNPDEKSGEIKYNEVTLTMDQVDNKENRFMTEIMSQATSINGETSVVHDVLDFKFNYPVIPANTF